MSKFLFKIFRKSWLKFAALILIFAVSITMFTMLYSTNAALQDNVDYFEDVLNQEEFRINALPDSEEVITQLEQFNEDLAMLNSDEMVASLAETYNFTYESELSATVKAPMEYEYGPYMQAIDTSTQPSAANPEMTGISGGEAIEEGMIEMNIRFTEGTTEIGKATYTEGEAPNALNEIAIPVHFAAAYELGVGDEFKFDGATYNITGIFIASSYPIIASPTDVIETLDTYAIVLTTEATVNQIIDNGGENVTPGLMYKCKFNESMTQDERLAAIEEMTALYPAYDVQVPVLDENGEPILIYEDKYVDVPLMETKTIYQPVMMEQTITDPVSGETRTVTVPQPKSNDPSFLPTYQEGLAILAEQGSAMFTSSNDWTKYFASTSQAITAPKPLSSDPSFLPTYQEGLQRLQNEGQAFLVSGEWKQYFVTTQQLMNVPTGVETEATELPIIFSIQDKSAISAIQSIPLRIEMVDTMNRVMYIVFTSIVTVMMVLIISKILYSRRKDIGVLISFGYHPNKIRRALLVIPISISLIASILALFMAYAPSAWFMQVFNDFFALPITEFHMISWQVILFAVLLPLAITTAATYFFASRILNSHVVDLLNNRPKERKVSWMSSHFSTLISKMKFKSKLRTRSLLDGASRMFLLFVGVVVSMFLLVMVNLMVDTMSNMVNSVFDAIGAPYVSVYAEPQETEEFDSSMAMFTIGTVDSVEVNNPPEDALPLTATDEKQVMVVGITDDTEVVNVNPEYAEMSKEGVVLPYQFGATYGLSEGDTITITDAITQTKITLPVAGIQGSDSGPYAYVSIEMLQEAYGYGSKTYNAKGFESRPPNDANTILIIESETLKQTVQQSLAVLYIMVLFIALFAMLILIPIILVISSIIIDDNIKTISVLKAFGYKNRKIRSMLINIYIPILIVAMIVGASLGIFFNEYLSDVLASSMGMTLIPVYQPSAFIISAAIIVAIYALGIWIAGLKLKKIEVSDLLKDS